MTSVGKHKLTSLTTRILNYNLLQYVVRLRAYKCNGSSQRHDLQQVNLKPYSTGWPLSRSVTLP